MRIRPVLLTLALLLLIPGTAFADGGNVMGTVYVDGQQTAGLCVDVLDNDNVVASQLTNVGGEYNIYVAQPGWYTVRFNDCGVGFTTTQTTAAAVVSDADTPNVNGYLSSAGRVTGNLKDNLNAVLTGACVQAEDQNGLPLGETVTDGNGNYVLGGLPAGQAYIRFEGCSAGNYVRAATSATVAVGETTSGIDAVLQQAGRITGHVHNADGEALPGVCVGGYSGATELVNVVTDSNGAYEISGVPSSGTYELSAWDCFGETYLTDQRTGPVPGNGTATVDFTLPRPGHITGHVRDEAGTGLGSICVRGDQVDSNNAVVAQTDKNGYYELNQVAPGTYDLTFSDCHSTGDWVTATTLGVVLADGQTLMDIDRTLAHPVPAEPKPADPVPADSGQPGSGEAAPTSAASGEPVAPGGDAAHPQTAACKPPKVVGLTLPKAKKRLRAAHCKLGKVTRKQTRKRAKKRTVLAQRLRGASVALTVAK